MSGGFDPFGVSGNGASADVVVSERELPKLEKDRPAPPLEEWLEGELAVTRADVARRKEHYGDFTDKEGADRMARSERYLRLRYQGYKDGEIERL